MDETYVGGKPRRARPIDVETYRCGWRRRGPQPDLRGRKRPVVVLVERNGNARARHLPTVTTENLKEAILEHVNPGARLMTDEHKGYVKVGRRFCGGHGHVKHRRGEYVRGNVHVNTAESFFSLLKRAVYGTWHNVSTAHLHRYVSEAEFRWNTRHLDDGARVTKAIRQSDGKRLMYRHPRS